MSFEVFTSPSHFASCLGQFKHDKEIEVEVLEIATKRQTLSPKSKLKFEDQDVVKFQVGFAQKKWTVKKTFKEFITLHRFLSEQASLEEVPSLSLKSITVKKIQTFLD